MASEKYLKKRRFVTIPAPAPAPPTAHFSRFLNKIRLLYLYSSKFRKDHLIHQGENKTQENNHKQHHQRKTSFPFLSYSEYCASETSFS